MKHLILLAGACLAAGCTMNDQPVEMSASDEAQLSTQLRGYEPAGPPVSCVDTRRLQGNRSAGEGAIVFTGAGGRKWVNRPPGGCPTLDFNRALQTQTPSTRLCRGDIATVFDPLNRVEYGGCGLGDFEPYRRVRS